MTFCELMSLFDSQKLIFSTAPTRKNEGAALGLVHFAPKKQWQRLLNSSNRSSQPFWDKTTPCGLKQRKLLNNTNKIPMRLLFGWHNCCKAQKTIRCARPCHLLCSVFLFRFSLLFFCCVYATDTGSCLGRRSVATGTYRLHFSFLLCHDGVTVFVFLDHVRHF
jgi:hypothetical protein